MKQLYLRLKKDILSNINSILSELKRFENEKNSKYSLINASEEFCYTIGKQDNEHIKSEVVMNIGFPFPTSSRKISLKVLSTFRKLDINFYIRGEPVRSFQREQLFSKHRLIKISEKEKLIEITTKIISRNKNVSYIDPYTFIGDSYIGLFFLKSFLKKSNLKLKNVYSKNYLHLIKEYCPKEYIPNKISEFESLVLMPDLIDSHWPKTLVTIKRLWKKSYRVHC